MKVIYVAGWMRSGTTLMSEILGAQPRAFNAGEVSGIWSDASRGGRCSCGDLLLECDIWGRAIAAVDAEEGVTAAHRDTVHAEWGRATASTFKTRNLRQLITWAQEPETAPAEWTQIRRVTSSLLRHALELSGSTVLVDSSKLVPGLLFYLGMPDVELSVVQVLRDPRAVAASEARTAHQENSNADFVPPGSGVATSVTRWWGSNLSVAAVARALRLPTVTVHYEHLVDRPAQEIARACQVTGQPFDPATIDGADVMLGASHVAVGNPSRSAGGTKTLHLDDRWKQELHGAPKALATAAALPVAAARSLRR